MTPSRSEGTPHIKDESTATELVNKLSFAQCEELYKKIRFRNRKLAQEIIQDYLAVSNKDDIILSFILSPISRSLTTGKASFACLIKSLSGFPYPLK